MARTLIIQLGRLGDCLQTTSLLASWHGRHPSDRITVLAHAAYVSIFKRNPSVDEVMSYGPRLDLLRNSLLDPLLRIQAAKSWLAEIEGKNFDTVINLTHNPLSAWLVTALRPSSFFGLAMDHCGKIHAGDGWSLYLLSLLKYRSQNLFNIVDIYARLSGGASVLSSLEYPIDDEDRKEADVLLGGCASSNCLIGFQPGANKPERRWPVDNFIRLGCGLFTEFGSRILVFGTSEEEPLARRIAMGIPEAINLAGRTGIPQLAALLERCRVLVTNDTGTMHLAAAVGIPVVAMFESSAYLRETGPYGSDHWILQSSALQDYEERTAAELKALARIPVPEVRRAVRGILAERGVPALAAAADLENITANDKPLRGEGCEKAVRSYRSIWENGMLDFCPVDYRPLDLTTLFSYIQRLAWISSLGGTRPGVECVEKDASFLRDHYSPPVAYTPSLAIEGALAEITKLEKSLAGMKNAIQTQLHRLARNPGYVIPENQVEVLNLAEKEILEYGSHSLIHPFISYYETAASMVRGRTNRDYLHGYLKPVLHLERQVETLRAVLEAWQAHLPAAAN